MKEPDGVPSREGRKPTQAARASVKPLTPECIRNVPDPYVAQRESSAQMLKAMLERRLMRRLPQLGLDAAAEERAVALPLIGAKIARLEKAEIVSDAHYAEVKARSALASGRSLRRILQDLGQKEVDGPTAQQALLEAAREVTGVQAPGAEPTEVLKETVREAVETFAYKKRLGPYRSEPLPEARAERSKVWRREAGAMARARFEVDTTRKVLDQKPKEDP